jgi:two-component system chemotaxis response regulator CheB
MQSPWWPDPRSAFDIVAVGSSAGGLFALKKLFSSLTADFPAATVVVQHLDPRHPSLLAAILGRQTPLRVKEACEGDQLAPGIDWIFDIVTSRLWTLGVVTFPSSS